MMKINNLLIALLLFSALLLAACSPEPASILDVPEGVQAGQVTAMKSCEFQPAGGKTKYAAECRTLVVPENWDRAGSRLIALPVVRIRASGPKRAEPVFFLKGGPGGPNLVWSPPDWLLKNHDVVMVGYRGVEGSVTLSCPEINRLFSAHIGKDIFSEQAHAAYVVGAKQCAARLQKEGVDLSGYTIPGVVADLEAARKTLGYGRIDLYSRSYGTRVAQIYAYLHPDSLHRLVMIGVNTPGHFIWDRAVLDKMIGHISELCARDAACSSRASDFAHTMYEVNHNMPRRWLIFHIDPDSVRMLTQVLFFSDTTMPMVFDAYLAAGKGDPSGLAMINLAGLLLPSNTVIGDQLSKSGTADLDKYRGIASISLGDSIMGAPLAEQIWPIAPGWPIELIPKELRELQESDVEMLLVNGTMDFAAPPTAVDEARPYFHRAQIVLLPEFSHVDDVESLQPGAFERLITSYFDTGMADSSLFVYQPLSFKPRMSLIVIARLLVAAMVFLPALIILVIALVVRRFRRRKTANS